MQSPGTKKDVQMHLTILPHRLVIASLEKAQLPHYMHQLVQLLLLPDANADYFLSVSETDEEISLILPKESIANLPAGPLKVDVQTVWRAVEVLEGSLGFFSLESHWSPDIVTYTYFILCCLEMNLSFRGSAQHCLHFTPASTGIVQSLSKPLAAAGISILYVSTFDTDYVLIEERNLIDAMASLRHQNFEFMLEGEQDAYEDTPHEKQIYIAAGSPPPFQKRVCQLAVLPDELLLCKFRERLSGVALITLLRLVFYSTSPSRFFSFTATGSTNSIMLSRTEFERLQARDLLDVCADLWRVIKVDEGPLGFAATGIVSSLAVPLSEARVSIFYVSAYLTDFLLVRSMDYSEAHKRLNGAGFSIRSP